MQRNDEKNTPDVLDAIQLNRIEAVHRGFLYQHLYTVACLLLAQTTDVDIVTVELDEDIELVTAKKRIYIQVKTRAQSIIPSDISGALERFDNLRKEHVEGKRKGEASFVIVANQAPSIQLQQNINDKKLPIDVIFVCPQFTSEHHPALPPAWESITDAAMWCIAQAEKLKFSLLPPASLVWKLAGLTQLTASGSNGNKKHEFHAKDLPTLFEQLIIQLQDFPTPPTFYRPQKQEPSLSSDNRIRIICGLSGAGKTSWAAQAALHSSQLCAYYDTGDLPGAALASTLVRELAAKFATSDRNSFQKILLPGASGYEALRMFDTFLEQQETTLLVVLDNAHRIPLENLRDLLNATKYIRFILLCQPNDNIRELEAFMGLQREMLLGWDLDTLASAVSYLGGYATAKGYEQLKTYTGGLPLYVESAAKLAITEYECNIDMLCAELHQQKNSTETAQEIILKRVYQGFDKLIQDSLALLSLADVGLSSEEVNELLVKSLKISEKQATLILKKMRATGTIEFLKNQSLKVHDAVRIVGLQHLEFMDPLVGNNALIVLKELLIVSLHKTRDTSRLSLLIQVYIKLNDIMPLIAISGEELFHEMGININIMDSLERALNSETIESIHKFWALDGLVFSELREGCTEKIVPWLKVMEAILDENEFGYQEKTAYVMKKILFCAINGNAREVKRLVEQVTPTLPNTEHERIFDYNHAIALWKLKRYKKAEMLSEKVIMGYYNLLGIRPEDVIGKNAYDLWSIINQPENVQEHLKHLADALELYAKIRNACGKPTPLIRIYSMKFYNLACASDSLVRVGQDLADEFVAIKDYEGAKEVMEQYVLPVVNKEGLVNKLVQVRSQYAVILALCEQHSEANAEMQCLKPYFEGLSSKQRQEIEIQSNYINHLANKPLKPSVSEIFKAVGRNERCSCGSGLKYKKCHGI